MDFSLREASLFTWSDLGANTPLVPASEGVYARAACIYFPFSRSPSFSPSLLPFFPSSFLFLVLRPRIRPRPSFSVQRYGANHKRFPLE